MLQVKHDRDQPVAAQRGDHFRLISPGFTRYVNLAGQQFEVCRLSMRRDQSGE